MDEPTQTNQSTPDVTVQPAINSAPDLTPIGISSLTLEQRLDRIEGVLNLP